MNRGVDSRGDEDPHDGRGLVGARRGACSEPAVDAHVRGGARRVGRVVAVVEVKARRSVEVEAVGSGAAPPPMTLARVVRAGEESPPGAAMPGADGITVVLGAARVLVEPGFDAGHLRAVLKALGDEA